MEVTGSRQVHALLAWEIAARGRDFLLVGVDGVDGSGKTTFADDLARHLSAAGVEAARTSVDDHLNPRQVRWRQGRGSPKGFFEDSYDVPAVRDRVLAPFRATGRFVRRSHDLASDTAVDPEWERAARPAVLVVDGLFLHRDELAGWWDASVFLDVPFSVSVARMAGRDGSPPDPDHPSVRRYVVGQRLYFRTCGPWARATWVVDNSRPHLPSLVHGGQPTHAEASIG